MTRTDDIIGTRKVTNLHLNVDTDLTSLTVADTATGERSVLETTQNHPFWDATAGKWVDASKLTPGHRLLVHDEDRLEGDGTGAGSGGGGPPTEIVVVAVDNHTGSKVMRDLTVADIHTYHVLASSVPVLVHNTGGCFDRDAEYDQLPEYNGTTVGRAVADDGSRVTVSSGDRRGSRPLLDIVDDRLRRAGRLPQTARSRRSDDAEQKVAGLMWRDGVDAAEMVINNPAGPCKPKLGCMDALDDILGPRELTVHWKDALGKWKQHTFGGRR